MGNYLDKWKTLFPEVVGGTKRPLEAISDQDEFNTNGFPQFIAQDPVRYDLQNAFLKQFLSNDAWLWVRQQQADQALDRHKDDAQAHPNGVSGNAASATKLQTARSLNLGGAVTADAATFDGTADTTINVKTLDATKLKGTASVSTTGNAATATKLKTPRTLALTGKAAGSTTFDGSANASINIKSVNADTASKLSTARKINITGNATGAAAFDGTSDVSINVTVNSATKATNDGNGDNIANTYLKKATVIDVIYPIGSIYMSMSATNPADLFGVGTWKRISQGRMLLGADDSTYKAGATGGEKTHTLTAAEMPAHSHSGTTSTNGEHSHSASWLYAWSGSNTWNYFAKSYSENPGRTSGSSFTINNAGNHNHTFTTDNTGDGTAHNNMPPYLVCYIWQRTA